MKKRELLFLIFLSVLTADMISAVEINLSKSSYNPQETLQAEITGNFLSLDSGNILLYKDDSVHSTPVISDLTYQAEIYYFYAILPNQEGNFSLRIEDAEHIEAGKTKIETFYKNFTIKKTDDSVLSINPGFIITSKNFSIKVKSLNKNQEISAILESTKEAKTISLIEESEKTLEFLISEKDKSTNLKINNYAIPVFVIGETSPVINKSNVSNTNNNSENHTKISIENKTQEEIMAMDCIEIGRECKKGEKCNGETVSSLDGPCCIGECAEKSTPRYLLWLGVAIIIVIAAVLFFSYFKARKMQKPKSTEDILKEKSIKFEDRMKGNRVAGGISRD